MTFGFSVLLSLYYKEQSVFLRQSLDSIFMQTLQPSEVILVKDGPLTNDLDEVVNEYVTRYPKLKIVSLLHNQGLGKALNEGLKHCSYDLVARMDTDDIAKPNRFEKQIEIFNKYPDLDVVGAWIDEFEDEISNIISIRKLPMQHDDICRFAKKRNPINHPVVMFRKQAVISAGGYKHFPLFEDYYLWIRMLQNGAKFYNIQESLLYFRFSADMFKRRGGFKYINTELRFQNLLKKIEFITFPEYIQNISIRIFTRILPNSLRSLLYKRALRK